MQHGSGDYISVGLSYALGGAQAILGITTCTGGTITIFSGYLVSVNDGMTLRATIQGTTLWVYANDVLVARETVPLQTGNPGIGGSSMPSGNGFTSVKLGPHDTVAPNSVVAVSVASSVFPAQVSLQWQGTTDDANGIGIYSYRIVRNGYTAGEVRNARFTDDTLSASTTYNYQIIAIDQHTNEGTATAVTVVTPPASAVDPRRTGVRTTGSYWGAGGEQIDTLSGNLSYSLPMVTMQGRTGWKVPLTLSYNVQNWRQDGGVNWQLGSDTGYGYGWQLQAGSVTPYYVHWALGPHHFVYRDATGAEYRLDVNNSGVWSSKEGIHLWFDAAANTLHFKDGSFWVMGATSGGTEPDAGTMYPTVMQDVNGNRVILTYLPGVGLPSTAWNTSSRITSIEDTRAQNSVSYTPWSYSSTTRTGRFSYTFTFNNDSPAPHLAGC